MPYLLIAPAIAFCVIFRALPLVVVGGLSFWKTDFMEWEFAGWENYAKIFTTDLWQPIPNTAWYVILIVPATVLTSLFIALIAQHVSARRQHVIRFLFYLPSLVSGMVISMLWKWVFHYDGVVNWFAMRMGFERVIWFSDRITSVVPISFIQVLTGTGFYVIIFMAALKAIPVEHYDAARVEGATRGQIRRRVMIPQILPTVGLATMMITAMSLQMFGWVYMLAPYPYAATMMYTIFHEGFLYGRFGVASAYSVLLMAITVGVIYAQRRIKRWR